MLLNASQGVGQARDYCRNDLLARALLRISGGNPIIGFLIAELLGLVGILGGGYIVSKQGDRPGAHFLPIYDARQLAIVVFVYIFVIPFVWGFYLRDLIAIPQTFQRLSACGAINSSEGSEEDQARQASVERFLRNNLGRFNHLSGAILTLVAIAVVIALFYYDISLPTKDDPFRLGYELSESWWSSNPYYLILVWYPITFSGVYMVAWILWRRIATNSVINQVFIPQHYRPILLHPDRVNGVGAIGDFAMRLLFLAFVGSLFISFFTFLPLVSGFPPNIKLDTFLYLTAFATGILLVLAPPVWNTHKVMMAIKRNIVASLSKQVTELILPPGFLEDKVFDPKGIDEAEELRRKYEFVKKEAHTWPFTAPTVLRDVFGALLPLLPIIITYLLQILPLFPIFR
jgi:hypothetical protein